MPSDASMRQLTRPLLVEIMACRLFDVKPLSEQWWHIFLWALTNKRQGNFNRKSNFFIEQYANQIVVFEMAAILSRPQSINRQEKNELNYWNSFSIKDPVVHILQVNSLWRSYGIWRFSSRSIAAEEMANITWINVDLSIYTPDFNY